MNITPTARQITDYNFTLSSQDLMRYLADPQAWADDVRAQLNGALPAGAAKRGPNPKGAGRRHGRRASKTSTRKVEMLACPECKKPYKTAGRLSNHMLKMHTNAA